MSEIIKSEAIPVEGLFLFSEKLLPFPSWHLLPH
jgi:hypothetical protein